jgi:hypothetical protein
MLTLFIFLCVSDYAADVKDMKYNSLKADIANTVKPLAACPSPLKTDMDDDSVSVSISVVQDDEPVPFASEPNEKDVVTVTRILHGSDKEKPLQGPTSNSHLSLVSNAEGVIQSKITVSGARNKSDTIIAVVDAPQVTPSKSNACEQQANHAVKIDGLLGLTDSYEKEINDISPEKSDMVSILKKSSDASLEFTGLPNMQGKVKSEETKRKTDFNSIVPTEPQKPTVESANVEGSVPVSGEKQSNPDEVSDVGGKIPGLGAICYTVMPSQRKRVSICVNKSIKACPSLALTPAVNKEATESVAENFQKIKLKQQGLDGNANAILASNENKMDVHPSKNVRISEMNRSLQSHVKVTNINEECAIKNLFSDLPNVVSPNITTTNSINTPSIKKGILQHKSSDIKYVVYDNSLPKLVPTTASSGNKVGYHIVTSSQGGGTGNALSCSGVAKKTAVGQRETLAPVYLAVVSSAGAHAAGTTNSISVSKVNIMAAVRKSNQQANQTGPQVGNNA